MARDERGYVLASLSPATRTALAAVARFPAGVPPEGQDRLVGLAAQLQPDVQLQLPARLRGEAREPDARLALPQDVERPRARVLLSGALGGIERPGEVVVHVEDGHQNRAAALPDGRAAVGDGPAAVVVVLGGDAE